MTTSDDAAAGPASGDTAPGDAWTSPIPVSWFSYAAAVTGLSALLGSVLALLTHWNDDSRIADQASVGGVERLSAALNTLAGATLVLLVVAVVADRAQSRTWAVLGAAAYALSFVLRAALEQRQFSIFD